MIWVRRKKKSGTVYHSGRRDPLIDTVISVCEDLYGEPFKAERRTVGWFLRRMFR